MTGHWGALACDGRLPPPNYVCASPLSACRSLKFALATFACPEPRLSFCPRLVPYDQHQCFSSLGIFLFQVPVQKKTLNVCAHFKRKPEKENMDVPQMLTSFNGPRTVSVKQKQGSQCNVFRTSSGQ
eukprot:EG_transcript_48417